jgi:hypothetical protein
MRAILGVVLAYVAVATISLIFHWYVLTQDTTTAHWLRDWYLYHTPGGRKYNVVDADDIIPTIALGLAVGCITARRSKTELVWYIFILPVGIVALFPVYASFSHSHFWWSLSGIERETALGFGYSRTLVLGGFFACIGRISTQQFQGRTPDE